MTEEAGTAHFVTSYGDNGAYVLLASDRRADGVLLEALIDDQPKNDVIPKIVHGPPRRTARAGRWRNTQENAFVLLALDRYFDGVREGDAELRGAGLAGRTLRGRARVQGTHHRA